MSSRTVLPLSSQCAKPAVKQSLTVDSSLIPDDDRTIAGRSHMRRKLAASTPREHNRTTSSRSRNGMAFPSHRSDRQAKHRRFH